MQGGFVGDMRCLFERGCAAVADARCGAFVGKRTRRFSGRKK
jgi:hypothetical protein